MDYNNINDNELLYMASDNNEEYNNYIQLKYKSVVIGIAKRYYRYIRNSVIDIEDLIQTGYLALHTAVHNYQYNKNASFYTFAVKCINNEMAATIYHKSKKFDKDSAFYYDMSENSEYVCKYSDEEEIKMDLLMFNIKDFCLEMDFEYAAIFTLKINGFSYKEIAHLLDLKYKKVDYAIQKCKNKLKNSLYI